MRLRMPVGGGFWNQEVRNEDVSRIMLSLKLSVKRLPCLFLVSGDVSHPVSSLACSFITRISSLFHYGVFSVYLSLSLKGQSPPGQRTTLLQYKLILTN